MMKSNYVSGGIAWGVLVLAACNTSIVEPIGGGPSGVAGGADSGGALAGAGQSGDLAGSSGAPGGSAGQGGGRVGSSGDFSGIAGKTDCYELKSAATDAIRSNRSCIQNSDCVLINQGCLFLTETCGDVHGISKSARAEVTAATSAYEACAGKCGNMNACAPSSFAQCREGQCLDQPLPGACENIADAVGAQIADEETCSVVMRIDSVSLAVLGHALICGPRNVVDEAGARASANAAATLISTGLGVGSGELLSGPTPIDVWSFKQIFGDFGHLSAVSAASGQTLFWSSLDYGGIPGQPTLAGDRGGWSEALVPWATTEIGSGCNYAPAIARRDWDVRGGNSSDGTATPREAADQVLSSAYVNGVSARMPLTNAVTFHHGLGTLPTPASEYIVIVNAAR